jgi:tRNA pseudouridine55 synthase
MAEINGILIINKEKGWTSFDVVAKMRSLLKVKKIGHTGTLDPDAEGVLVLCVGKATKLGNTLTKHDKEYEATLLFGKRTDTQDISGTVLEEAEVNVSGEEAEQAALSFLGGYDQIPPMYSAKKVKGKKLYELAREGITVEREPRHIEITGLSVTGFESPRLYFTVSCSGGTYIRTLCEDIGKKAACPACMEALRRTRVGTFTLKEARTVKEVEAALSEGRLEEILIPIQPKE